MMVFTGPDAYILLIHAAIQIKMSLNTKSYALGDCWIAFQKHVKVTIVLNSSGFISLIRGLAHSNFVLKQLQIF
jgi:hypothetical protein